MAEDMTVTPCGPKECHETYYYAETIDFVTAVVVISLYCHTLDR